MRTEISGAIVVLAISAIILASSVASSSLNRTQTVASYGQIFYPNYTVWTEGGVYYVKDAFGTIDYSSPVASNVLNYASATLTTGGGIFVKDGLYEIASTLNLINPNIVLQGESWNTILRLDNSVNNKVITVRSDNCTIRNLQIDGNYVGQSIDYSNCILVSGVKDANIENCYIHDSWNEGINIQNGSSGCIVKGCRVDHTRTDGIVVYGGSASSKDITVSDCVVTNSGQAGNWADNLFFSGAQNSTATNCILDTCTDTNFEIQSGGVSNSFGSGVVASNIQCLNGGLKGIYVDGTTAYHTSGNLITNFVIRNAKLVGLSVSNYVEDCEFGNGIIYGTGAQGLYFWNNCFRNMIHDITINATGGSGVGIDTACTNNTLDNVTIANAGLYGMQLNAGCPNNHIENSRVVSSKNAGIITWADNTTVESTLVDSPKDVGIYLLTSNYCTISGNKIYSSAKHGIYMNAGSGNLISSNYISNIPSSYSGIKGAGACINDLIVSNYINCTTASGRTGIAFWAGSNRATGNRISQNTIYDTGTGIDLMDVGVDGAILADNQLILCSTPITDSGANTAIYDNTGYNPVGYIANPFSGNSHILLDLGGDNATWSSAVTYANWESPKTLYISNGTVTAVVQNGQTIFSATDCTVVLQPGDTFSITFSSAPTIKVEGH